MNRYEFLGGDTVKITGKFKGYDEMLVDPTNLQLKIYNNKFNLVDTVSGADIIKTETGVFHTEYILPSVSSPLELIFEWYGTVQEKPSLERIRILVKFV